MIRPASCARLFCAALLSFACGARAADPDSVVHAYRDASFRLASMIEAAEQAKDPERLKGEAAARLITVLGDDKRFLKPGIYTVDEMQDLVELCSLSNRAVVELTLFDARARIGAPKDTNDAKASLPKVAALMGDNITAFAPQLGRLQPFTLRCYAKEIAPMAEFVATLSPDQMTAQRSQGLLQMRAGLSEVFGGMLKTVREERYDTTYRLQLAQALAETAPRLVQALPESARKPLREEADASKAPVAFMPYLDAIRRALDEAACSVLCEL